MSASRFDFGPADWSADASLTDGVMVRRVFAFLIDGFVLSVICALLWVMLGAFGVLTLGLGLPLLGLIPLVPFLYNWLSLLTASSATPGQAILGLRVRRDADLGQPGGLQALVWAIGFTVTVSLGVIWFAVALITVRHRTLHDLVSGLVVVRAEALTRVGVTWKSARRGPAFE